MTCWKPGFFCISLWWWRPQKLFSCKKSTTLYFCLNLSVILHLCLIDHCSTHTPPLLMLHFWNTQSSCKTHTHKQTSISPQVHRWVAFNPYLMKAKLFFGSQSDLPVFKHTGRRRLNSSSLLHAEPVEKNKDIIITRARTGSGTKRVSAARERERSLSAYFHCTSDKVNAGWSLLGSQYSLSALICSAQVSGR